MAQQSQVRNPFMLMIQPEVVLAAVERSERLSSLNRHLCRPLDRPMLQGSQTTAQDNLSASEVEDDDERFDAQ